MIATILSLIVLHAQAVMPILGSTRGSGGGAAPAASVIPVVIATDIFSIPADQVEVLP
jgi:hypothetical protein